MANQVICFGDTDVGLKRQNNEDAFVIRPDLGLYVVADGMGGAAAGEVASRIFVETAVEIFANGVGRGETNNTELIQKVFGSANERIFQDVEIHPNRKGMGCTAEVVVFSGDEFILGHLGDSRTYRYRNGRLKQLSNDHSFVQDQIDQGLMTPAEAKKHPLRNIILQAVGVKENLALDLLRGKIYPGDQFLLCSDGLTDMVADQGIAEVLSWGADLSEKAKRLIDLAKSAGGKDNITIVLTEII